MSSVFDNHSLCPGPEARDVFLSKIHCCLSLAGKDRIYWKGKGGWRGMDYGYRPWGVAGYRTSIGTQEVEHMLRCRVKSRCWGVGYEKVLVKAGHVADDVCHDAQHFPSAGKLHCCLSKFCFKVVLPSCPQPAFFFNLASSLFPVAKIMNYFPSFGQFCISLTPVLFFTIM